MMVVRTVMASRYVTPLREGGSLPAIVEADDDGLYVLKFRGAGQGPKALIAELLGGEIARLARLPVPEIVFVELPADLARTEPDQEISDLIGRSVGLNIALDYLPGSVTSVHLRILPAGFPTDIAIQLRSPYESRADAIMRCESASFAGPPNIMAPRQSGETFSPLRPSLRYSIGFSYWAASFAAVSRA